jgi:uncharacterized protein YyaL (SSP411 family)
MRCDHNEGHSQTPGAGHAAIEGLPDASGLAKLPPDGGPIYNRLVFEKSPYLLQHARNPVDWYPWGEAAFAKARKEDKPIFLSIGYSTCHWCHVMEHESFEDPEVARLMNEAFICVKVDREERPDVDHIYMSVCQAMTGSGGWPMTIIMTPEKEPFFAGTYFPKSGAPGRIGMMELVPRITDVWTHQRDQLQETTKKIQDYLQRLTEIAPGEALGMADLETTARQLSQRFDAQLGGFGSAPKFPTPHHLTFLLRYWHRHGDEEALAMVEKTLEAMRRGGIFDHVGFGFHRYATDAVWLLPHFEKMLYDQALLTIAYIEAHQATGKEAYARTAREICTYVLRDMTSEEGGFYSAEDADSEGEEGLFYVWTPEEIDDIVGAKDGAFVRDVMNVETGGNFVDQATRQKTGRNILHMRQSFAEFAAASQSDEVEMRKRWQLARTKLFAAREKRIHPLKDDKILTDWNGLMIAALAKASAVLDDGQYREAAQKAADFVLSKLRDSDGRLLKRYRGGEAGLSGHAEDYAFVVWGLLELYEATFELKYLQQAIELNRIFLAEFWDAQNGGFFFTSIAAETLLVRSKEIYDGAIPSANSVAAGNLARLSRITGDQSLQERAARIAKTFSQQVKPQPSGFTQFMSAIDFLVGPTFEVVVAGQSHATETQQMLSALQRTYHPNKVILFRPEEESTPGITSVSAFTLKQRSIDGKATAYVCREYACKAPTTNIAEMLRLLDSKS